MKLRDIARIQRAQRRYEIKREVRQFLKRLVGR